MFILSLIILKCAINFGGATTPELCCSFDWQLHVFHQIINTFRPSQITLFLPNSKDGQFYNINHILENVIKNVSTMIVDTNSIKADDPLFNHTSFWYPRLTNMFVIVFPSKNLLKRSDVSKVQSIIDLMVDIAPKPTRPRCLLVIFGSNQVPENTIASISSYAWSRKFIDFTTLVLRKSIKFSSLDYKVTNQTLTYHYYNPFLDRHFSGLYKPDIDILPNKLKNLYGYKLVVAATKNPPFVLLERNETGYPILNHTGSNHRMLRILRKAMNFTFELAPSIFEYYTEGQNDSLVYKLQTGEINLSMNHLFLSNANAFLDKLERSVITIYEEYTALIPKTLDKRVKASKDFFIYVIVSIVMFIVFFAFIHIMKFDKRIWSGMKILEILLNVNIRQPTRWPERFVFFCITFMAFNFTVDILTELTEIQFEPYDDLASNNLTLLGKRGYTPVILEQFQDVKLEDEILEDKAFLAKLKILKNAEECAYRLERGEKIVCFLTKYLGKPLIIENLQKNKDPTMKLLKPYLWSSWKTIVFEPGTPFLDGFNDKLERLRDVGLLQRFVYDVTYHENKDNRKSSEEIIDSDVINIKWLYNDLFLGYTLATVVLFLEIISSRIRKALTKRYKILLLFQILRYSLNSFCVNIK